MNREIRAQPRAAPRPPAFVFQARVAQMAARLRDDHDCGHDHDRYEGYPKIMAYWMTHTEKWNGLASHYVAMGNEASLEHLYARICLLVEVGPPEQRAGQKQAQQENN